MSQNWWYFEQLINRARNCYSKVLEEEEYPDEHKTKTILVALKYLRKRYFGKKFLRKNNEKLVLFNLKLNLYLRVWQQSLMFKHNISVCLMKKKFSRLNYIIYCNAKKFQ